VLSPLRNLFSFQDDEMLQDSIISFLLPSCAKAQALALESLASLYSQIISQGYDTRVKIYIDDEALKDI